MIRYAKPEDANAIASLVLVILKDMELPFVAEFGEVRTIALLEEAIQDPEYRYGYARGIVAEIDGQVAGIAFGYPDTEEETIDHPFTAVLKRHGLDSSLRLFTDAETFPDEWYLDTISVSKDFRGHGVGTKLLNALPELAQQADRSKIGLSVDDANPKAKKLYERSGFVKVGDAILSGHHYDHMQKQI